MRPFKYYVLILALCHAIFAVPLTAQELDIRSTQNHIVRIDGGSPLFMSIFENGVYRGYFGSFSGASNDMDLGTGAGNTTGKLHLTIQASPQVTLNAEGNVGIGTTNPPSGYKLSVAGRTLAEEVRVQLESTWPDYVFDKDYRLLPISHLKSYIDRNHHLPDIPPASVVEAEGIDVGDMHARLLRKIEELTLHIIDLNARIEVLESGTSSNDK